MSREKKEYCFQCQFLTRHGLKRVLKDGFPKDEDRLQVLKLLAQET
jgi:hypothetical protein